MNKEKKALIKLKINFQSEMDYHLFGIGQEEIDNAKINTRKPETYKGSYTTHYDYNGLEILYELVEKYEPSPFNKYGKYFHPDSSEIFPYYLNDGRILTIGGMGATFYKNEIDYIAAYKKYEAFSNFKSLPKSDYPITRIHHLPDRKLYYKEIDPIVGEALSKLHKNIETTPDAVTEQYRINKNWLLIHRPILKTFEIFRPEDYQAMEDFWATLRANKDVYFPWPVIGRNHYGNNFVNHVPDLIAQLPDLINAPEHLVDGSQQSFYTLRKYLLMNLMTDEFGDKLYLPLLAYFGQHFIEHHEASWQVTKEEVFGTWIPDILYNGKLLKIYQPILKFVNPREEAAPDLRYFITAKSNKS